MFNGNINNKHYTNPDEYYRDLAELSKKGESFTSSCSYSICSEDSCDKEEKREALNSDSVQKFVEDNVIDFDKVYENYLNSRDKKEYIQKLKDQTPWLLEEDQIDRLNKFTAKELKTLCSILQKKYDALSNEQVFTSSNIASIDNTYKSLNAKREQIYNDLKNINDDINNLLKKRENFENNQVIQAFLESVYDNLDKVLGDINGCDQPECHCDCDKVDTKEDAKTPGIEDLLTTFKDLYSHFLS